MYRLAYNGDVVWRDSAPNGFIRVESGSRRTEKQPTDLRRHHHYMRDGTLANRLLTV